MGLPKNYRRDLQLYPEKIGEDRRKEILNEIDKAGLKTVPAGGLVLTGGSSKLAGLKEMASDIWPGPVRIGMPAASSWVPHGLRLKKLKKLRRFWFVFVGHT